MMRIRRFSLSLLPLLCLPSIAAAAACPWLNAATAGGILGGPAAMTVTPSRTSGDATCSFIRQNGSRTFELRIEVETMRSPAADFGAYKARCHIASVPLKAIGNEAFACSDGARAEQVIGRVREHAFVVRISVNDGPAQADTFREKARQVAEQVAGILF